MSTYQAGDTIRWEFPTHNPASSTAADADDTPTGVLLRNGTATAETVTVANQATGIYLASATVPEDWEDGDEVQLRVTATVAGITGNTHSPVWVLDVAAATIAKLLQADRLLDTSTTPWQLVLIERGTGGIGVGTELLRQDLKDEDGNDISSINDFIGQQVCPP